MTNIFKPASKEEIKQRQEKYSEIKTKEWIAEFEKRPNVTKNEDGSYDVKGNVDLNHMNLTKFPIKFRKITGYFVCSYNQLTTLEGEAYSDVIELKMNEVFNEMKYLAGIDKRKKEK